MDRSTIDAKTLATICSIPETREQRFEETKSALVEIRNSTSLSNRELRRADSVLL